VPGSKNFYRYVCITCGAGLRYRFTYLYDEKEDGHRCKECWNTLVIKTSRGETDAKNT
jgi:DNA-directed RNA polymerase subunit RPC12/RpoP